MFYQNIKSRTDNGAESQVHPLTNCDYFLKFN